MKRAYPCESGDTGGFVLSRCEDLAQYAYLVRNRLLWLQATHDSILAINMEDELEVIRLRGELGRADLSGLAVDQLQKVVDTSDERWVADATNEDSAVAAMLGTF